MKQVILFIIAFTLTVAAGNYAFAADQCGPVVPSQDANGDGVVLASDCLACIFRATGADVPAHADGTCSDTNVDPDKCFQQCIDDCQANNGKAKACSHACRFVCSK